MPDEKNIRIKFEKLTKLLIEKKITVTTMESCTGGLIASLISDTEGASAILKGAFITYSNEAKILEGVPSQTIDKYGVYSKETALVMADACRKKLSADIGIGITGSFENVDPANKDSVPGQVFFAIDTKEKNSCHHLNVPVQESRYMYKLYTAEAICDELLSYLSQ